MALAPCQHGCSSVWHPRNNPVLWVCTLHISAHSVFHQHATPVTLPNFTTHYNMINTGMHTAKQQVTSNLSDISALCQGLCPSTKRAEVQIVPHRYVHLPCSLKHEAVRGSEGATRYPLPSHEVLGQSCFAAVSPAHPRATRN